MNEIVPQMETSVAPLTQKAINSIANCEYLTVWEGAVRSGKTVASSIAWIMYVMNSPENIFIMSGKTIASLYRNVISGDFGMIALLGDLGNYHTDREGNRVLEIASPNGIKKCYCFGANDERAYQTLRGITAGGWYADEINLHPRSFLEEAFRRTIVSRDRKNLWTLNPDNPNHYIYTEYVDRYEEEELPGFHLWHFLLTDNNAIPPERKEELKAQYRGIFYRRYILGERCIAEGVVYDMFDEDNLYDDTDKPYQLERHASLSFACDYGTTNPMVILEIWDDGDTVWVDDEYRWDSKQEQKQKTDFEYAEDYIKFQDGKFGELIVDPSAASFKAELRTRGMWCVDADNDVMDGIRALASMIGRKKVRFHRTRCKGTVAEMRSYMWNPKLDTNGNERPLKELDHGPDAIRYFVKTKLPAWRVGLEERKDQ